MGRGGVRFDRRTLAVVLKACAGLEECGLGIQVHAFLVKLGFEDDVVAGSALLDMYAKCKRLDDSLRVFSGISEKNWVCWSAIIAGCILNYRYVEGFRLFKDMLKLGVGVSQSIYASVFRCCADLGALRLGTQLHGHAVTSHFGSDVIVGTATLDMYAKCGSMRDARKLFNSLPKPRLQSYNAIIVASGRNGDGIEALRLFLRLLRSGLDFDAITLSGVFSACASTKRENNLQKFVEEEDGKMGMVKN
ncbi:hypothetical protein Tsubulata_039601 [Turnera subulata]|uniref:Pentatricopeptide repeat-containing protein n=1 Tax=Turnera subulata TaxID=218843 RepID=A0A9Q0J3A2_9ROSI|nr:hypothetical protein Tsubulata_039601 [Turnera subulata]